MSMSLVLGLGAYVRDKNTSAILCTKKAGGGGGGGGGVMHEGGCICGTLRYVIEICEHGSLCLSSCLLAYCKAIPSSNQVSMML